MAKFGDMPKVSLCSRSATSLASKYWLVQGRDVCTRLRRAQIMRVAPLADAQEFVSTKIRVVR